MACGKSGGEGEVTSKKIDQDIKKESKVLHSTIKILLLGAGQSGKTTFLKQIQHLYSEGFNAEKLKLYRRIINANVFDYAELLVAEMQRLGECKEDLEVLKPVLAKTDRGGEVFDKDLGEALVRFWKRPAVQTFFRESTYWMPSEACRYFLEKLPTITKTNYEPSTEDIFRCRVKTTGIYELRFEYSDPMKRKLTYVLTDVGGQRSERNKWIHCFENVTAVIFFVDLSGYNLTLDEAPTVNRMDESIKLFDAICNSQWFKTTAMILFFNKVDIFKEKLKAVKFSEFVQGYYGDETYESTTAYLQARFLGLNKLNPNKPIYVHFTCATDTRNMKFVFSTVTDTIIRKSLKENGLM